MIKNKYTQLLLIYVFIVSSLIYISLLVNTEYEKQFKSVENKIDGVEYISKLYNLNINVAKYLQVQGIHNQNKISQKAIILENIDSIYRVQKKYPHFANKEFNTQLKKLQNSQFLKDDLYNFIDIVNKENYAIANISEIHFQRDKELYFLGTLMTHYIPEYLLSTLVSHGVLEKYLISSYISDEDKNIYVEQNKLIYLSLEELSPIIKLYTLHSSNTTLQKTFDKITSIKLSTKNIFTDKKRLLNYITQTHIILELSYKLYNDNFLLMERTLQEKKHFIQSKLYEYKIIFSILIITFSLLMFLYYRLKVSNITKDRTIQDMTEILDEFVIFSKADKNGIITYVSSALEAISGYSQEELIGSSYRIFKNDNMNQKIYKTLWRTILAKKTFHGKLLNRAKDGREYWVQETITPEIDTSGNIISFNAYMVDITDKINLENAHKKLQELSIHDSLTQVYNRLKLDTILQTHYESYKRYKKVFSVIILDIDYFKEVNDKYGHLVGDEVLKQMAQLIKANLRGSDYFGRWGGEEFLIISEFTIKSDAYVLAEKIRKVVSNFEFDKVGYKTVSIGLSQITEVLSINDLLQEADDALYKAKNSGRNRTIMHKE